ncbi:MAG: trigger factor [Planctomycetes bacterium]|nr:trigger factor [Planctomycetota bacterium]
MDVQVAESGSCRRSLTVRVSADDIRAKVDQLFREASGQVRLKGFRSGRIPRKVLETKLGPQVRLQAKERIVQDALRDAFRQHDLHVVGQPKVAGVDGSPIDETKDLEFTVELDVRPQFELGDLGEIEVDERPTDVTDDDVEQALQQLAAQKRTLDEVDDAIQTSDFLTTRVVWLDESGAEVHRKDEQKLSPAIPLLGTDPDSFRATLVDSVKGDTVEVELTFPDNFEVEAQRGKPGRARIEILGVQRVQPAPIDDELAKAFDHDTLDALRARLRERIGEEKQRTERNRQEDVILGRLADMHPFDLPESMVEQQLEGQLADFRQRLAQAGRGEEEIEQQVQESHGEAQQHAERMVRLYFLFDAIARQEQLTVTEAEFDDHLRAIAAANDATPADVRRYLEKENRLGEVRYALLEQKVRELLRQKVRISDRSEA